MQNNNYTTFIVLAGIFILSVFTFVVVSNLLPNNKESASYYVKIDDEMNAYIETLYIENNILYFSTFGDALEYCIKTTRSTPNNNNICWKKVDTITSSPLYITKTYFIWIKDTKGNISKPIMIKANNKKVKNNSKQIIVG